MDEIKQRISLLEGKKLSEAEFCELAELYAANGMLDKALAFINREISYVYSIYYDTANNLLGVWYYNGKYLPKDYKKAKKYFEAASFGYMYAQYNLGRYYFYGRDGAPDYIAASVWLDGPVKENYLPAIILAAEAYFKMGGSYNIDRAIENAERAVAMGSEKAAENLKRYLEKKKLDKKSDEPQLFYDTGVGESALKRDDEILDLLTVAMGFGVDGTDG